MDEKAKKNELPKGITVFMEGFKIIKNETTSEGIEKALMEKFAVETEAFMRKFKEEHIEYRVLKGHEENAYLKNHPGIFRENTVCCFENKQI